VSNNFAANSGGGTAESIVNNCTIVNNVAGMSGGGAADLAMTNCFIGGNSVSNISSDVLGSGGGAGGLSEPQVVVNCVFVNNRVIGTNGAGGGVAGTFMRLYNCTFTNNSASVGGAAYGGDLYDCILVANQATNGTGLGGGVASAGFTYSRLERCLLLGNSAINGGGVAGGVGSGVDTEKCVFGGNSASVAGGGVYGAGTHHFAVITNNGAANGGGFYSDDLNSSSSFDTCLFSGNLVTNRGGATYGATSLYYCTVAGNSAGDQGGGIWGTPTNHPRADYSIIYYNSAPLFPNCDTNSIVASSCTTPAIGGNNFANEPAFVNLAAGNYRLSSNSPCINYVYTPALPDPQLVDLDGNPRQAGSGFDLGAYEFQNPKSVISYLWLQQLGLPTDGSADYTDPDGDSFNNFSEWRTGTDPFDATSLLRFRSISVVNNDEYPEPLVHLEWQSVPGVPYTIDSASDITGPFTYVDFVWGDPTNTVFEIPMSQLGDPTSCFFRLHVY
jgi:hypothetical protein